MAGGGGGGGGTLSPKIKDKWDELKHLTFNSVLLSRALTHLASLVKFSPPSPWYMANLSGPQSLGNSGSLQIGQDDDEEKDHYFSTTISTMITFQ